MKSNLVFLIFTIPFYVSCSAPKFYSEITSTYSQNKTNDNIMKSSIQPHKIVLKTLKNKLENSDHIIYLFSVNPEWSSKEFYGVLYYVTNDKYYYYENNEDNEDNPRKIIVNETYQYPEDNYCKFVLDNYRNGK